VIYNLLNKYNIFLYILTKFKMKAVVWEIRSY